MRDVISVAVIELMRKGGTDTDEEVVGMKAEGKGGCNW